MATKLRYIADEIELTIKQTFDDKTISYANIVYWIILAGNTLKGQHISKRDSGRFLSIFNNIPVQVLSQSQASNPNAIAGRKHIELPGDIFDFDLDKGILYIAYNYSEDPLCEPDFTRQVFTRTNPALAANLYEDPYTVPSPRNPYFYVAGQRAYFLGIERVNIKTVEAGIFMLIPPVDKIENSLDKDFDFPDELLEQLKYKVLAMARFSYMFPSSTDSNTGQDDTMQRQAPVGKIMSVNQQPQTDQNNQ
jgi:hypothetical protein